MSRYILNESPFDINSVVFHFDDFNYGRRITTIYLFNNCNSAGFFSITYNNTVLESVRLKSLIDVLICKLHYGFGGIRQLMLSRKVSFSLFLLNSNNPYVQKLDRMRMIDWCKDCIFVFLMY